MSKAQLVAALVAGIALPLGAVAADTTGKSPAPMEQQQPAGDPPGVQGRSGASVSPMFDELDANHDGYISPKEAERSATLKSKFKDLDKNHDGKISPDEWKAGGME